MAEPATFSIFFCKYFHSNLLTYMRERGLRYRCDVKRDERDINTILAKIWIRRRDSKEMIEIRVQYCKRSKEQRITSGKSEKFLTDLRPLFLFNSMLSPSSCPSMSFLLNFYLAYEKLSDIKLWIK